MGHDVCFVCCVCNGFERESRIHAPQPNWKKNSPACKGSLPEFSNRNGQRFVKFSFRSEVIQV